MKNILLCEKNMHIQTVVGIINPLTAHSVLLITFVNREHVSETNMFNLRKIKKV